MSETKLHLKPTDQIYLKTYKLDVNELCSLEKEISEYIKSRVDEVTRINLSLQNAIEISHRAFIGATADSIRAYLEEIHTGLILPQMCELLDTFSEKINTYIMEYSSELGDQAKIDTDVLQKLSSECEKYFNKYTSEIDPEIETIIRSISDIAEDIQTDSQYIYLIEESHMYLKDYILDECVEKINEIERTHTEGDFVAIDSSINALKNSISELMDQDSAKKYEYKSGDWQRSSTTVKMYFAGANLHDDYEKNKEKYQWAREEQQSREARIEAERLAERQKQAELLNEIVGGLAIVGTIVAVVAFPAAAPVIVGTITGIKTVVEDLSENYVADGELDGSDWARAIGHGAIKGTISGVCSAVGGSTASIGKRFAGGFIEGTVGTVADDWYYHKLDDLDDIKSISIYGAHVFVDGAISGTKTVAGDLIKKTGVSGLGKGITTVGIKTGLDVVKTGSDELYDGYKEGNVDWELIREKAGKKAATSLAGNVTGTVLGTATKGIVGKLDGRVSESDARLAAGMTEGVKETVKGISGRAAGELYDQAVDEEAGIDWNKVKETTFDGKEMATDLSKGAAEGYRSEWDRQQTEQYAADRSALKYNRIHNPVEEAKSNGITGITENELGGIDWSKSEYSYKNEDGKATFKVSDLDDAYKTAGISEEDADKYVISNQGYDVKTKEYKIQFVEKSAYRKADTISAGGNSVHKNANK